MAAAARGIPLSPYTGHLHWIRCPFQIVRHQVSLPLSPSAPSAPPAWRVGLLEEL